MNRTFVGADNHNHIDFDKIFKLNQKEKSMDKSDVLIICGDFGFPWDGGRQDRYYLNWLDKYFKGTLVFVDGNHCNIDLLYQYPIVEKFGNKVHKLNDSVYHLMRGNVYQINGSSFFAFGGAESIDKKYRTEGVSWWPQEMPNVAEEDRGLTSLDEVNWEVDFILTHDVPFVIKESHHYGENNSLRNYLAHILKNLKYKQWFFGHHHIDRYFENYDALCLYENIVEITE